MPFACRAEPDREPRRGHECRRNWWACHESSCARHFARSAAPRTARPRRRDRWTVRPYLPLFANANKRLVAAIGGLITAHTTIALGPARSAAVATLTHRRLLVGPLDGIKVIEIASLAPAPFGCMILADLGADVLRVDRAERSGPDARRPVDPLSRSRRSIGLNLKDQAGVDLLLRLTEDADVLV